MKVLIVDDEPLARARISRLLELMPDWQVVGEAANGHEALMQVEELQPDVVLMDIRMPGIDGLEAARHIANYDSPPSVIFTTAYGDHALEAFDAQALGYILKPVQKEKLEEALSRAQQVTRSQLAAINDETSFGAARTHIASKQRGGMQLIPLKDVLFFQADQKYVTVRHVNGEVIIEDSLKSLEEEFGEQFTRIHRKTLVAKRHLKGVARDTEGRFLVMLNGCDEQPEVSRRHVSEIKALLSSM